MNFNFKGRLENKEILKFYFKNNIKFFIHLSSTEGLPVSMMEVQSFGIPIIATNVGGVNEIVNEKTGILLSANPTILEIIDGIEKILNMSKNEYDEYRINSYINWHENFNAKKNYKDFVMELFDENKKI
nr:glycosyltransferase [Fusobacterium varium]